ncbi:PQQ-binding-like beta-propeller repeat protein [Pseudomonas sp. s4]|uniref:outer membrane protein assembly factor BamB family protein n=1 Tax=Pseudomonas sp. s4 TaxID=353218 RepID=UPI00398D03EA
MKFRVLGGAIALCVGLSACKDEQRGYFALDLDKSPVLIGFAGEVGANLKNNYVSVAPLGQRQYVLANYQDLILFKRDDASLCRLDAKGMSGSSLDAKSTGGAIYNPTGVYATEEGHLFVANYKGNNVLEGSVDAENCTFVVAGEFSSPDTRGPENVVVDKESGLLLSANYDAGTIVAFDTKTKKQVWAASVPQAHGVTVSNGKVYATGLTERKLYELDLKSGQVLRAKGAMGWDPMTATYMWPTSIYPLADGNLVVSDPQSGYVSVIDPKTLDAIRYTGGNGPAHNLLNYPYASVPDGDELIVLSSMRGSLVFLKQKDMSLTEKYSLNKEQWPESAQQLPVFGKGWDNYRDKSGYAVKIAGKDYGLGFGQLYPVGEGAVYNVPDTGSLFNPGAYIYFMQGYTSGKVSLLFSSSSTTLLAINSKEGRPSILLPKFIGIDSWKVGDALVSGTGGLPFKYLVDEVGEAADAYYAYLDKRGWVDVEHLFSLLGFEMMGLDYATFQRYLDKAFISPAGREFKLAYDQCQSQHCDIDKLKEAAKSYYKNTVGYPYLQLAEYSLVGMVTGVTVDGTSQQGVSFDDCAQGSYYDGYGVDALKTATLADYLSAIDLEHSSICFNAKGQGIVHGVEAIWNDSATAPKSIEIYGDAGDKGDGKSQWEIVGKYTSLEVVERNGYALSSLDFDNPAGFKRFWLKVTDGGAQNRLILRQISPVMSKEQSVSTGTTGPYSFVSCPGAQTYPGFGIEALDSTSLNDYYSAVAKETSSVCMASTVRGNLARVTLGWYSGAEIGQHIEVLAARDPEFKQEVSLGQYQVPNPYNISGYLFSDIHVQTKSAYPYYRVKLLDGKGQGRLILRSLTPMFASNTVDGDSELRRLAASVSAEFDYGKGLSKFDDSKGKSLVDIENMIGAGEDAHCGNYALVFVNRLPKGAQWQVFDLSALDGRIHSVVEVKRKGRTSVYDPTLGVEYRCSLESMLQGKCNYSADLSFYQVNPALQVFRGAGFFYGATVTRTYSSAEELMSAYF